jgi:hypothetical protein
MKLSDLLFERKISFEDPNSWENADATELINVYVDTLEDALEYGYADKHEMQTQFKKLHDKIAKLVGSRDKATLMITQHKQNMGSKTFAGSIPKNLVVMTNDDETALLFEKQQGFWKATFGTQDLPAKELEKEVQENWDWELSRTFLPRIKQAIEDLKIPFQKTCENAGSYHENFYYLAVIVFNEDAIKIIDYINSNL